MIGIITHAAVASELVELEWGCGAVAHDLDPQRLGALREAHGHAIGIGHAIRGTDAAMYP